MQQTNTPWPSNINLNEFSPFRSRTAAQFGGACGESGFFYVVGHEERFLREDAGERCDHTSVHEFSGTCGEYLLGKVSRVFPELRREVS